MQNSTCGDEGATRGKLIVCRIDVVCGVKGAVALTCIVLMSFPKMTAFELPLVRVTSPFFTVQSCGIGQSVDLLL